MYTAAVIYFLFHFEVGMLLKTLLKSFNDSVLVPYFTKMPICGPHRRKLMHVKWQLLPGKVQDAFQVPFCCFLCENQLFYHYCLFSIDISFPSKHCSTCILSSKVYSLGDKLFHRHYLQKTGKRFCLTLMMPWRQIKI